MIVFPDSLASSGSFHTLFYDHYFPLAQVQCLADDQSLRLASLPEFGLKTDEEKGERALCVGSLCLIAFSQKFPLRRRPFLLSAFKYHGSPTED